MRAVELAKDLCVEFEGLHILPYLCPAGVWTVGYGRVLKNEQGRFLTSKDPAPTIVADGRLEKVWLEDDLVERLQRVKSMLKVGLPAGKEAALLDFSFNLGLGALRASTLLRRVNAGDWHDVARQFRRWKYGGGRVLRGLIRRREAEIALWEVSI